MASLETLIKNRLALTFPIDEENLESGEIYETYPSAKDKQILIRIACKYQPTEKGDWFLQQCKEIIKNAGFKFEYLVHSE